MNHPSSYQFLPACSDPDADGGWSLLRAAAAAADAVATAGRAARFSLGAGGVLEELDAAAPGAVLAWVPDDGWRNLLPVQDPRHALVELYLPVCSAHPRRPLTVAHLGQSLDGFVATSSGDSRYVNGPANILHLHRMRALCDAVIVGAGTVSADNPQLTTRRVPGPNPLRVVLDPARRLDGGHALFRDGAAPTLRACLAPAATEQDGVTDLPVAGSGGRLDLADLLRQLHARGCARIFVEGGGITVSAFLQAGLLDRLQIAVASLLIGDGRPALRLPPSARLAQCLRPRPRVFRMGQDVFYDCDLTATRTDAAAACEDVLTRLF